MSTETAELIDLYVAETGHDRRVVAAFIAADQEPPPRERLWFTFAESAILDASTPSHV